MESVLKAALRKFISEEHIKNVLDGEWTELFDEAGKKLSGIKGRSGAVGLTADGVEFGADLIEMQPGSAFPLHIHAGDHLLYIIEGPGVVHVDGVDHHVVKGDTVFVPADYPHGVRTYPDAIGALILLAVGHPHKHVAATDRMHVVADHELAEFKRRQEAERAHGHSHTHGHVHARPEGSGLGDSE